MIKQYIEIDTLFEALHHWPDCPYEDVRFLKYPHRHLIYIKVKILTTSDRQIEFFKFKMLVDDTIDKLYGNKRIKDLGSRSMEVIGRELLSELQKAGYNTPIQVSVSEDNQVRSIIEYEL